MRTLRLGPAIKEITGSRSVYLSGISLSPPPLTFTVLLQGLLCPQDRDGVTEPIFLASELKIEKLRAGILVSN